MRERMADATRRIAFERSITPRRCAHAGALTEAEPQSAACPSCAEQGLTWVKLRMCLTCGAVGCCDSSPEPHARAHFEATGHPVMRSIEPGEQWAWCYPDRAYIGSPVTPA